MKMGNAMAEESVPDVQRELNKIYEAMEGSDASLAYSQRHNIRSAAVLTVIDDETASLLTDHIAERIAGRTVVEIGGGIGLLALHMGMVAKRVYCIEANPMWSWTFAKILLDKKPRNVSYLFGQADEFLGQINGDVAVFATHSDLQGMRLVAEQFAPSVIDIYTEIIEANPEAYDPVARELRKIVVPYGVLP